MGWTFLLALGVIAAFAVVLRRINILEQELRRVESLLLHPDEAVRSAPKTVEKPVARIKPPAAAPLAAAPWPTTTGAAEPRPAPPSTPRFNLETLIGGRLPIWIGGAALVLAGFFLVRYSIESGLLGPGARTLLAALFAALLVAASEAARRFPATADDPRVAQALAGAGIASFYATLYLAAGLYHLIAPLPAFLAVLAVTALALALSLRHGPPTAVMALAGGFMAPLVAGFDAAGIGPLLVYLALLVAALFGLAVHRGWGWLALAASIAGFGWVNFLILARNGATGDLSAVGAFTMLLAAGSSAALPATGLRNPWLRLAPLLAGFVQLIALAPALDFGPLAWSFYLVLAAATLFLAWRDPVYLPAAPASAALLLLLEALALLQPELRATPIAALLATALFALPGHIFAQRARAWAAVALLGTAGPLLVAHASAPHLLADWNWGLFELAAAAATASLAWRLRNDRDNPGLFGATALTGFLAALGMAQFVPFDWLAIPLVLVMAGFAAWARHMRAPMLFELPAYPFAAALVAAALPLAQLANLILAALFGERLPYLLLPDLVPLLRMVALPTILALLLLRDPQQYGRVRNTVSIAAISAGVLLLYAIAKQPLAIGTLPRFTALGFLERALLTQACLAVGWLLLRRMRLETLGKALLVLGLARFVWFDLLAFNPVIEPQSVGAIPLFNAAVFHAALAAFWLWTLPGREVRLGAMALTLVAACAAVRQAAHGDILTGPVGTGESTGYSAALLAISLFWLWRGISAARHDLRVAGLALLTLVTFKVFLIDAAALDGILRILSFLGLGIALIGIGWAYGRFLGRGVAAS